MKIAVQAMNLRVGNDARAAGVARSVVQLVVALANRSEVRSVRVFLDRGAIVPAAWRDVPKLDVRIVRKYRIHRSIGGFRLRAEGYRYGLIPIIGEHPLKGLPMTMLVHDVFPITHPEWFDPDGAERMSRLLRDDVANCADYVCNSRATEADLHRVFPETVGRSSVCLMGPGHDAGDPTRDLAHLPLPPGPFTLAVSTIEPRKNLPRLLEALAILRKEDPEARLVIAGGKGWETSGTFARLSELGLDDAVTFLGFVADEDLLALYARAELFVFPSLEEGFGLPVLEAMSMGTPCLLSRSGSLPEVGGDVARYCDPLDPEDIAREWRKARSDSGWRATSGPAGRDRAATFTWDRFAEGMIRHFRSSW